jgi:hypothetical protein
MMHVIDAVLNSFSNLQYVSIPQKIFFLWDSSELEERPNRRRNSDDVRFDPDDLRGFDRKLAPSNIGGLAVFGIGVGIIAMTDMHPPESRGFAVGKLYTASVVGSFVAPVIAWAGEVLGATTKMKPISPNP